MYDQFTSPATAGLLAVVREHSTYTANLLTTRAARTLAHAALTQIGTTENTTMLIYILQLT